MKNGLALVGKKKFHLAAAFLICGKDIKGAVQIILTRCNDPCLCVLICKTMDPKNETKIVDQVVATIMRRATEFNDPYLANMGLWIKREFVQAVNQMMPSEDKKHVNIMRHNVAEFDISALEEKILEDKPEQEDKEE